MMSISLNKTKILNTALVFTSGFILIKASEIPYLSGYSIEIFNQFSQGNQELFSVASSVLAAYIFYAVNTFIPHYLNRKKALESIDRQLTQVIYRCIGLLYIHRICLNLLKKETTTDLHKIISTDLERKINLIEDFTEYLTIDERRAINKIRSHKNHFAMRHERLESLAKEVNDSAIFLVNSIDLPSAHTKDIKWFKVEKGEISFPRESSTFKLFLAELAEYIGDEANKLPDVKSCLGEHCG